MGTLSCVTCKEFFQLSPLHVIRQFTLGFIVELVTDTDRYMQLNIEHLESMLLL